MESMSPVKKPSIMSNLRDRKGFSLVEMAIVLVIIGIIIGAVMKGQDIITNSRAKQVTTAVNTWKALAFAYLDRNGRLPGDASRDGVIGRAREVFTNYSTDETVNSKSAIFELKDTMQNAPSNPVIIGSLTFYTYFGNSDALPVGTGTRNIMLLCKDAACATAFSADELEIVKAIDTAIDGAADAYLGQFRGNAVAPASPASTWAIGSLAFTNYSASTSTGQHTNAWTTTPGYTSAIWAFDRPW